MEKIRKELKTWLVCGTLTLSLSTASANSQTAGTAAGAVCKPNK